MTTLQMLPQDLVKGDTIAVHPKTKARGDWIADGPAVLNSKVAKISVTTPEGMAGQIVVDLDTKLDIQVYGRPASIAGLRRLAQLLEDNPEIPVSSLTFHYFPSGEVDGDLFEEVDRVAALLGVEPKDGGHYKAVREFGGRVSYEVVVCERRPTAPDADEAVEPAPDDAEPGTEVPTLTITKEAMTSSRTAHTAVRYSGERGWVVSWLPGRVLSRHEAIGAMTFAEIIDSEDLGDVATAHLAKIRAQELGLTRDEAIRLMADNAVDGDADAAVHS